jgi:hypothetical protein
VIGIQEYSLKRGFSPDIERVKRVFVECFDGVMPEEVDGKYICSFGALETISFWFEGGKLCVETVSRRGVGDEEVLDTNRRFRKFLEGATGYTAKQRLERAKKEVSK